MFLFFRYLSIIVQIPSMRIVFRTCYDGARRFARAAKFQINKENGTDGERQLG